MAWTLPVSRTTGYLMDAPVWNTEHVGNLLEMSTIQGYTPTWTTTGTAPNIQDGSITGSYIKIGKRVDLRIVFQSGPATTYGTGIWSFTLPLTADSAAGTLSLFIQDVGTQFYTGVAKIMTTTTIQLATHAGSGFVSQGTPFTWTALNLDNFTVTGTYFTASV